MNKNADRTITLDKGRVDIYQQNGITLYAYQTRDAIEDVCSSWPRRAGAW